MFIPKYTITNRILVYIGQIEAARAVIAVSPIIPSWASKFRKQALEETIHYSTALEGNHLNLEQVQELLDGQEVMGASHDIQEVLNYKEAMKFVSEIAGKDPFSLEMLMHIHRILGGSGQFRASQVVVRNTQTGEISYTPPPAAEVSYLIEDLVHWIGHQETRQIHPMVKAAIVQYELSRIHPFTSGNGLVARVVTSFLLATDKYDFEGFFSLEEYLASDPVRYHLTHQSISNQKVLDTHERDITSWLEYFVFGAANKVSALKDRVRQVSTESHIKDKLGEQVELTERQMIIMEYLKRHKFMRNADFRKIFPDYSDDTVLRELKFMKQKGLVQKVGGTKKAQYVLK